MAEGVTIVRQYSNTKYGNIQPYCDGIRARNGRGNFARCIRCCRPVCFSCPPAFDARNMGCARGPDFDLPLVLMSEVSGAPLVYQTNGRHVFIGAIGIAVEHVQAGGEPLFFQQTEQFLKGCRVEESLSQDGAARAQAHSAMRHRLCGGGCAEESAARRLGIQEPAEYIIQLHIALAVGVGIMRRHGSHDADIAVTERLAVFAKVGLMRSFHGALLYRVW